MQKKKGISLIVLVITIIVMVILAGAIVLTLNNSGIIQKASDAVEKTNEATIKEVAQLGWAEAYAEYGADQAKLEEGVKNALTKNNINPDEYKITVTTSGVTIKAKKDVWEKDGFVVKKGDQVLEIGDRINYTATGTTYNGGWQVLGVDDAGNLLIMSSDAVEKNHEIGMKSRMSDEEKISATEHAWNYGITELHTVCEPFGKGTGVVGKARCITAEDINKVTGYDPTQYQIGNVNQYGNVVTYKHNGYTDVAYTSDIKNGNLLEHNNGFYYFEGDKISHKTMEELKSTEEGNIVTYTSTAYGYYGLALTTISAKDNAKAFEMIFGECDGEKDENANQYWIASRAVGCSSQVISFGWGCMSHGTMYYIPIFDSMKGNLTNAGDVSNDVRAVVTLQSDITLTGSSETGWSYTVN